MRLLSLLITLLTSIALVAAAEVVPTPSSAKATAPVALPAAKGPRLIIKDADPKAAPVVQIDKADISISIAGPLAQTTTILTIKNTANRVLEGELEFPLPENAAVSGYGLDVNGILVDGVPVEKQRARQIFESEVRKGVDPGILEQTRGNNFKTRVYPIPANGQRIVKISYVQDLALAENTATYAMPLAWDQPVNAARIHIASVTDTAPKVEGLAGINFERWANRFVGHKEFGKVELAGQLVITVPSKETYALVEQREKVLTQEELAKGIQSGTGEFYFLALAPIPQLPHHGRGPEVPQRIAIYWDASLSREKADKSAEFEFLRQLCGLYKDFVVDVVPFRNVPDACKTFAIRGGKTDELLKFLQELPYDGATNLDALRFARNALEVVPAWGGGKPADYPYALLFTDGIATLGAALPAKAPLPVHTLCGDARADHAALRYMAASTGGDYFNLRRLAPDKAAGEFARAGADRVVISYDEKQLAEVFPRGAQNVNWSRMISGKLLVPEATLTVMYLGKEHKITLKQAAATSTGLVPRFWAQQKIADLAALPEKNAEELLAIGKQFSMVTPNTSLLVLERVEQYLQHRVVPPKSHPDLYKQFIARIEQEGREKAQTEQAKIDRVLALWNQRVKWWETEYKVPKDFKFVAKGGGAPAAVDGDGVRAQGVGAGGGGITPAAEAAMPAPPSSPSPARNGSPAAIEVVRDAARAVGTPGQSAPQFFRMAADKSKKDASPASRIEIKQWDPNTPYIKAIKDAEVQEAYAKYLEQRKTYGASPAFFIDVADYFLRNEKLSALGVRILTNIAELKLESAPLLRVAAYRFSQTGYHDLAIDLFEKARRLRPDEPQSDRDLALALAARARTHTGPAALSDYRRSLELFHHVVMNPWERFPEIEVTALMEANALWADLQRSGAAKELSNPFDPRLVKNLECDLRIVMTWDADMTDIDLHVVEPTGEECNYGHNRTTIGGLVSHDFTQGYGPEEYCIRKAQPGGYKIFAHFFGSHQQNLSGATTVQATVITNFGRANEKRQALTLRLDKAKDRCDIGTATIGP